MQFNFFSFFFSSKKKQTAKGKNIGIDSSSVDVDEKTNHQYYKGQSEAYKDICEKLLEMKMNKHDPT